MGKRPTRGYRTVDLKIEVARLEHAESLDLSGSNLKTLPGTIADLTDLRTLDLDNNQLSELPESLGDLTQLESLSVFNNRLAVLPNSLSELRNLKALDIGNNQFVELPECLRLLSQLKSLDLSFNEISRFPRWLSSLGQLESLDISGMGFMVVPEVICELTELIQLDLHGNLLSDLPQDLGRLTKLNSLSIADNRFISFPEVIFDLQNLQELYLPGNSIQAVPETIGKLHRLRRLIFGGEQLSQTWSGYSRGNDLTSLPLSIGKLLELQEINLDNNPLSPELSAAYEQGVSAVVRYLRSKAQSQVVLNEAKLILIGEGEVGKSSLLAALRNDPWEEGKPTTHGIEIKPVKVVHPETLTEITLNGWDFGGQRVYRPTHQLFFSAPAVYLVVWKPREGPQQGFVKDWIKLVKHREPAAKILVVATHGGPKERQPDIDRQEIWDLFGNEMVHDFFLVESKPDSNTGERAGILDLKLALARAAARLPEVGRTVPQRWEMARRNLKDADAAYLALHQVLMLCQELGMDEDEARDFIRVSHRLGHLIHYEHDPALRDIVILKPDWLAAAVSFVLDDKQTRQAHGLVEFSRLTKLWNDPQKPAESRYNPHLHPLFLRLMERFDLSYKVSIPSEPVDAIGFWQTVGTLFGSGEAAATVLSNLHYTSLIAQLVPDIRPDPIPGWYDKKEVGDQEQAQICRITESRSGHSAAAEGLFFQLIVRLHKYSLGRLNYLDSVHWKRGLVLEDDYGARALLEHVGNDVRILVRSPYPERFLAALTYEVKWLVENFWAGLQCDVMVPCLNPTSCLGLFEVRKLIENKKRHRPEQPCGVCNEWQNIEELLHNAPGARPNPLRELLENSTEVMKVLRDVRTQLREQRVEVLGRFDTLDASGREMVSKVEDAYIGLMRTLLDEAKEGPRLFSFAPTDPGFFDRPKWISEKFQITLWCEHSRLPLPMLNGKDDKRGVYELTLPRKWLVKAAPFLKVLAGTLSLVVPVAASATEVLMDETSFKGIEKQLDLGQKSLDSVVKGGEKVGNWLTRSDALGFEPGEQIRANDGALRQLRVWLKEKDPSFGDLVRVQNKRQEFLWVHPQFEKEY